MIESQLIADQIETTTSGITLDMLREHFHLPIQAVAAEFGICVTKLKKICRIHGIARWPQRKVLSLNNMIDQLQSELASGRLDDLARDRVTQRLNIVKTKKRMLYENPNIEMTITPSTMFIMPEEQRTDVDDCKLESRRRQSKIDQSNIPEYVPCSSSSTSPHHNHLPHISIIAPIQGDQTGMDFEAFCATIPENISQLPSLTAYFNASPKTMNKCRETRIPLYFPNVQRLEMTDIYV